MHKTYVMSLDLSLRGHFEIDIFDTSRFLEVGETFYGYNAGN